MSEFETLEKHETITLSWDAVINAAAIASSSGRPFNDVINESIREHVEALNTSTNPMNKETP